MVDDPRVHEPVLCGHARLVVTGAEGHRVHEELIQAGGFIRDGRLERLGVTALREVMQLPSVGEPRTEIEQRLLALHASLEAPLRAALDARTKDRVDSIRRLVAGRQDEETEKITSVMTELRDRILAELGKTPPPQLALWQDDERDQLERNRHYLQARADRIPAEIERETDALRRRFADPTPRVFPVAVEYLVPRALDRA
jgi:hypothetical protein